MMNAECRMQNEEKKLIASSLVFILHSAFIILHFPLRCHQINRHQIALADAARFDMIIAERNVYFAVMAMQIEVLDVAAFPSPVKASVSVMGGLGTML
jgi:hypothetical protein